MTSANSAGADLRPEVKAWPMPRAICESRIASPTEIEQGMSRYATRLTILPDKIFLRLKLVLSNQVITTIY